MFTVCEMFTLCEMCTQCVCGVHAVCEMLVARPDHHCEEDDAYADCGDEDRSCCRLMPMSTLRDSEQTFVSSLRPEKDELPQMIEKMSIGGKSGAPLYFTHDSELIVKSIPDSEFKFLSSWAGHYCEHMERNPDSVLVRLYGLYEIQLHETQKVFGFIVMRNVAAISGVTSRCATVSGRCATVTGRCATVIVGRSVSTDQSCMF